MKRFMTSILLIFTVLLGTFMPVMAADEIQVVLDGRKLVFEQPPVIVNDRTMVPMRAIFEALGATVTWDSETRTVSSQRKDTSISLTINKNKLMKNGKEISLDVPAQIVNDRTMVPVRAITESFDCDVGWDAKTRTVTITTLPPELEEATIVLDDGTVYTGQVLNGKPNGYGMIYDKNKNPVFEGTFQNGLADGICINYLSDGYLFGATYVNGMIDKGKDGVKTDKDRNLIYAGQFDENFVANGTGREFDPLTERLIYEGEFKDGKYHGTGAFYSVSGILYDGGFSEGWYSGEGWLYNSKDEILHNVKYEKDYLRGRSLEKAKKKGLEQELQDMREWAYQDDLLELREWYREQEAKGNTALSSSSSYDPYETSWAKDIFRKYDLLEVYEEYKKLDPYTRTGGLMNPAVAQKKSALKEVLAPAMNEIDQIDRQKQGEIPQGVSGNEYERMKYELKVKYELVEE